MEPRSARTRRWAALVVSALLAAGGGAGAAVLDRPSAAAFVPNQIVVSLRAPEVTASLQEAGPGPTAGASSAAASPGVRAERVEELRTLPGVIGLRRALRRLEDEQGRLVRRTRDEVRARLAERGVAPGVALDATAGGAPALENVFVVELEQGFGVPEAVAAFLQEGDVAWAEPNWIYRTESEPLPDLPYLPDDRFVTADGATWARGAWGQDFPDLYGLRSTRSLEAWNRFDLDASGGFDPEETPPGEGVLVAVIDTGVDATHPDLAGNIWSNPGEIPGNGLDDDGNGFIDDVAGWDFVAGDALPSDPNGHGTHVAGTIAALTNNAGLGVAGVAPATRILPLRGLASNGAGTSVALAAAIEYAVAVGADVTSSSWGGPGSSQLIADAFAAAEAAGVLNVTSAGNGDRDAASQSPASLASVVAVAAVDHDDRRASFSNFGKTVEISAPGVRVLSLNANAGANAIARSLPDRVVDGDYLQISGTSMSCPHVSGAAAVLMSAYPGESAPEIRGRLMAGARPLDARNPSYRGRLGAGTLDVAGSLDASPVPIFRLVGIEAVNVLAGEQGEITIRLRNFWAPASNVTAALTTDHPDAHVDRGDARLGSVGTGDTVDNRDESFLVSFAPGLPFGEVPFTLTLRGDGGFTASLELSLVASFMSDVSDRAGVPRATVLPHANLFQDYDGDGHPDILLADLLHETFFYESAGDGTFSRGNRRYGINRGLETFAAFFVDVDNDADRDILLGGRVQEGSRLLMSQGGQKPLDISQPSGIASHALLDAALIDVDRDGLVDVLGGQGQPPAGSGPTDRGSLHLLRNRGDLTFEDVREEAGLPEAPFTQAHGHIATLDHDDDGDTDVIFSDWSSGFTFWQDEGDGRFVDRTAAVFPDFAPESQSSVALGDCDNDGDIDVFATGPPSQTGPPSRILLNEGGVFRDAGGEAGDVAAYNLTGAPWGTAFFDVDHDGDLDLYVTKDVNYPGSTLPGLTRNPLFLNEGGCRFRLASDDAFPDDIAPMAGAAAMADFDGDGDIDLYTPGSSIFGKAGGLLRNELGDDLHWLAVDLEGTESARDAYGARVTLEAGGLLQTREIHSSPVDAGLVHFGLGQDTVAERLEVRWPSGIVQEFFDVAGDRVFRIVEVDCGAGWDLDGDGVCDETRIAIDVAPWNPYNFFSPGSDQILPVAVLGSDSLDATALDPASLAFGPGDAEVLTWPCRETWLGACPPLAFVVDVDDDGFSDLLVHFRVRDADLGAGDADACLTGETRDGALVLGCDVVRALPACGIGFELVLVLPPLAAMRARRLRRGPAASPSKAG